MDMVGGFDKVKYHMDKNYTGFVQGKEKFSLRKKVKYWLESCITLEKLEWSRKGANMFKLWYTEKRIVEVACGELNI